MKTEMTDLHCMVKSSVKRRAQKVLDDLGTNMTDAIRMFLVQIAVQKAIPFEIRMPNKNTIDAINEAERKNTSLKVYSSAKEMFRDLDKDDD